MFRIIVEGVGEQSDQEQVKGSIGVAKGCVHTRVRRYISRNVAFILGWKFTVQLL